VAKPRRLTPEVLTELLAVHAQCALDQQHKCPLLIFSAPLAWEINQFCGLANDEDRGFKRKDEMLAARPLRPERFDREDQG
jgi:hypothetical protein